MDVRLPDGTIVTNVPEGTTREEVMRRAKAAGAVTEEGPRGSYFDALMQGLTLGWADELGGFGARIGARLAGAPEARIERAGEAETERQRASMAALRERDPIGSTALEIGGSLVPSLAGFRALNVAAPFMRPAAQLVAGGTLEGAIAGAGVAEENKLAGAGIGAGIGLGLAGAVPVIGYGARQGWEAMEPLRRRLSEEPTTTASRVLSETLTEAGVSPAMLRSRQRQLGPQAMFADVAGPSGATLGQGVVQADRTGQTLIQARRELAKRGAGSTARLRADIAEATGVTEKLQPSLDAVRARQQSMAGDAYGRAYGHDISLTPKLKSILSRAPMKRAFGEAKEAADIRGEQLPPFFQLDEFGDWEKAGVMPDMQAWDRMKQGIDRLIENETDKVTGRMSPKGRDLSMLKSELLTELDAINPDYATARRLFAGDEAIQNAMRQGEKVLTMKTREVQQAVDGFTDSEREAFLTGAVEAIREKMGRARAGEIGEFRFIEPANTREKLRMLFPEGREGDKQLSQLMRTLNRERTFATTQALAVGGSQTAPREAARRALETGAALPTSTEMLTSPAAVAQAAIARANQAISRVSDKTIQELGQMLFDPGNVETVIREMQRRGIPQEQINQFVNRFSRASAALSPGLSMQVNE